MTVDGSSINLLYSSKCSSPLLSFEETKKIASMTETVLDGKCLYMIFLIFFPQISEILIVSFDRSVVFSRWAAQKNEPSFDRQSLSIVVCRWVHALENVMQILHFQICDLLLKSDIFCLPGIWLAMLLLDKFQIGLLVEIPESKCTSLSCFCIYTSHSFELNLKKDMYNKVNIKGYNQKCGCSHRESD